MQNKNNYQAELFFNRISKNYKLLRKWARKNNITCYRLYDRDIPEVPVSLDIYEFLPENIHNTKQCQEFMQSQNERISKNDIFAEKEAENRRYAVLYLYERPYQKDENEEQEWLSLMATKAAEVLNIKKERIVIKMRKMQKGLNQYEKKEAQNAIKGTVQEQGQIFKIDLSTYIDTGLFFDHRILRKTIREESKNKRILNLFCYTGSFSVYAASGNANFVESVDLSNTYLTWAKENMRLNGFTSQEKYIFTKADVIEWLEKKSKNITENQKFDIIILDPPTFSNSKSTENILDINRDWPQLVENCVKLLNSNGTLYFSTNSMRLIFDEKKLPKNTECTDLTKNSIPKDFEGKKSHRLWKIILY